jgi:cbb3-type cytochrome oxidase maturation protein
MVRGEYTFGRNQTCMSVMIILIAASILIAGSFLIAFLWSVRNGQFDDDYTPSVRMLFEDTNQPEVSSEKGYNNHQPNK